MRRLYILLLSFLTFFLFFPLYVEANSCSTTGYTVLYVNGVLSSKEGADQDRDFLKKTFINILSRSDVDFKLAYNASHFGGIGDWIKSIQQAYQGSGSFVDDYDFQTLLKQIHREVNTEKILLVGHSQGSFYTNALYQYLTTYGGMSPSSVAVYNIATPASYVAGSGGYLTSSNDKLINQVRSLAYSLGANPPLPANITLPLTQAEEAKQFGGHEFAEAYLSGAPARIVSDVSGSLARLGSGTPVESDGCFILPEESLSYRVKTVALGLVDPVVSSGVQGVTLAYQGVVTASNMLAQLAESSLVYADVALRGVFKSLTERLSPQNQGAAVSQAIPGLSQNNAVSEVPVAITPQAQKAPSIQPIQQKELVPLVPPTVPIKPPTMVIPTPKILTPISPGFGGGSLKETAAQEISSDGGFSVASPLILSPTQGTVYATTSVTVSGTTTPGYTVLLSYIPASSSASTTLTIISDGSGAWSRNISLNEGSIFIEASTNGTEGHSASTTRSFVTDTTPPAAATFSIAECSISLSVSFCLSATTTAHVSWSAVAGASHYALVVDGVRISTSTSTSLSVNATLVDQATTSVQIVTYDGAGNAATSSSQDVATFVQPVLINEIAWAGTDAQADDEWIEFKNRSPYIIDLSRLALLARSGTYIPLDSYLFPLDDLLSNPSDRDIFLLERREEVTSTSSDMVYSFDLLSDSGEELLLEWGSSLGTSTLDQTPKVATCSGWCAGSAASTTAFTAGGATSTNRVSMERATDALDGTLASSWVSNDTYVRAQASPPLDAGSGYVYGTPGQENSSQYPVAGWYCGTASPVEPDDTYRPGENPTCTYLSSFINTSVARYGDLYYGTVGSSTLVSGRSLSSAIKSTHAESSLPSTEYREPYFVAIYENRTTPSTDVMNFRDYFTIGSSSPPHSNYRTIPWIYGPAPF